MEALMKKCGLFVLLLLSFLITFINTAEAKLLIMPPEAMVEQSTLIVIGTVTKKEFSEQQRHVRISVETVVKGNTIQKEIDLKRDKPLMYGWLGFDFPETGTRIMILLQQNDALTLTGDANAVAVLDDNHVKLYKGATMGEWTPERYEETYKAFLDQSIQASPISMDHLNDEDKTTILGMKPHHLKYKMDVLINIVLIVGIVLVTCFILYRILKRKSQNRF
jgi:hypothetical protein